MSGLQTNKICVRTPAKINLHLEIIGKREDGYHELAMIMQNIDPYDYIEFENNQIGEIELNSESEEIDVPSWCDQEITGMKSLSNASLAKTPISKLSVKDRMQFKES